MDILGNSGQTVSQEPVLAPAIESFISPMDNLQQQAVMKYFLKFCNSSFKKIFRVHLKSINFTTPMIFNNKSSMLDG